MPVRAPFPGTVLERSLSLGALVQPGDKALLLADTSKIWVMTTLYESELAAVLGAPGEAPVTAEVTVTAYPGRMFKGIVERVGGTLDEATRTTTARVVVENPDNLLRSGMFARVRLSEEGGSSLALPEEAILEDEGRSFVFVHLDGFYYIRRPVELGRTSGGWTEVTRGVSPGDTVVAKGAFLLKSDVLRSKMGAGCAD
jgi:RND family efflux transporter MFP subunit